MCMQCEKKTSLIFTWKWNDQISSIVYSCRYYIIGVIIKSKDLFSPTLTQFCDLFVYAKINVYYYLCPIKRKTNINIKSKNNNFIKLVTTMMKKKLSPWELNNNKTCSSHENKIKNVKIRLYFEQLFKAILIIIWTSRNLE